MKYVLQDEINNYGSFNHEKILIVDDNDTNIFVVKTILEDRKLDVDTALNGFEGLNKFEASGEFEYKVIFLDINMYDLNGYEVAKRIRKLKRADAKQIPIYALSANIFASDRIKAKEAGMSGYITKPINYKNLFSLIGEIVEEKPKVFNKKMFDKKIEESENSYIESSQENVLDNLGQHFIFNALNTIKGAIIMNSEQSCSLINDLSAYMQYRFNVLRENREVDLNEEIKNLKAYSRLEMARFSYIDIVIEEKNNVFSDFYIPAMSLFFLVENAVHHGLPVLKDNKEKKAKVAVRVQIYNNTAQITVEDNGIGFDIEKTKLSSKFGGLKYIEHQIKKLNNGKFKIESGRDRGTKVTILLDSWRNIYEINCSR